MEESFKEGRGRDTGRLSSLSCYSDGFQPSDCKVQPRGVGGGGGGSVENRLNKWRRKNKQALTDVDDFLAEGRSLESAVFVASVGTA